LAANFLYVYAPLVSPVLADPFGTFILCDGRGRALKIESGPCVQSGLFGLYTGDLLDDQLWRGNFGEDLQCRVVLEHLTAENRRTAVPYFFWNMLDLKSVGA